RRRAVDFARGFAEAGIFALVGLDIDERDRVRRWPVPLVAGLRFAPLIRNTTPCDLWNRDPLPSQSC
ncbi:MAG: hypothetical protein AAF967_13130, partial [Pseudomonadota bacterium]